MSEKKMIIRNCPAFDKQYNECHSKIESHKLYCQDCTDCVFKRVVELCKYACLTEKHLIHKSSTFNLANGILQKLDIEESSNEEIN